MSDERFRALPGGLSRLTKGSKVWNVVTYETVHTAEAIESPGYWLPLQNHLQATDEIWAVRREADGSWHKAKFEVLLAEPRAVLVERVTDWRRHSVEISGKLEMIPVGNDRFDVIDTVSRHTIKKNADRVEAAMYMRTFSRDEEEKRGPGRPRKEAA